MDILIPDVFFEKAARWYELKRWERREIGQELRRLGLSYGEIMQVIPVTKGTLSGWCQEIPLTDEQIGRIRSRGWKSAAAQEKAAISRRETYRLRRDAIRQGAREEFPSLIAEPFFLAGITAYWGEGGKRTVGTVGFSNSDPALVRLFLVWATKYLGFCLERFQICLHLHAGQNETEQKEFWSRETGLPLSQFKKTFFKEEGSGHRKNILYHGTAQLRISDSIQYQRVMAWLECLSEMFCTLRIH